MFQLLEAGVEVVVVEDRCSGEDGVDAHRLINQQSIFIISILTYTWHMLYFYFSMDTKTYTRFPNTQAMVQRQCYHDIRT